MSQTDKIAIVRAIFDAFEQRGDCSLLLDAATEDAVFSLTVQPGTPLSGEFRGRAGFAEYFRRMSMTLEQNAHQTLSYFASLAQVAVVGRETYTIKRNATVNQNADWLTLFTFRDSRICRVLVIEDTSLLWEAYRSSAAAPAAVGSVAGENPHGSCLEHL